jgi:hypothetical protein
VRGIKDKGPWYLLKHRFSDIYEWDGHEEQRALMDAKPREELPIRYVA